MTNGDASSMRVLSIQKSYPQIYFACHVDHVRRRDSSHPLSAADGSVLSHLDARVGVRPGELAAHLGISDSAFSATLARLTRLGFIERARSSVDRRAVELRLTGLGIAALQASSVLDTTRVGALLARLTPAEQKAAIRGIELLVDGARRLLDEEGCATRWKRRQRRRKGTATRSGR